MTDIQADSASEIEEQPASGQLPYNFARRHGVVVVHEAEDDSVQLLHKPGVPLSILSEVRRLLRQPVALKQVDQETLERQLSLVYETGSKQSTQIMETMGDNIDLDHAARALNQPEDLLESDDDAPIIRLINALFTEAIKEQASDIHIEP
jgi:general secretion pathway protein E